MTFDSLTVDASFFEMNREYKFTCTASSADKTIYGQVSKHYNTLEFPEKVGIAVSPARGAPYSTTFSIVVMKPTSEALLCVVGYKNSFGEVIIEDLSGAGKRYSSQHQSL